MGVSKVNYGNNTLIDISGDTVDSSNLLRGITAHNRDGNSIVGTMDTIPTWVGTQAAYEALTPEQEAQYIFFEVIDDGGYGNSYSIPHGNSNVGDDLDALDEDKADKTDLTNIDITGTTNSTGSTISEDTYFYLNGDLVRAKADIVNGATLTLNTNYEVVTAGGLNNLNADISSLRASLSNKIIVETVSETKTGTTTTNGVISNFAIDIPIINGYTPIIGYGYTDNWEKRVIVNNINTDTNKIEFTIISSYPYGTNVSYTAKVTIYVIYVMD